MKKILITLSLILLWQGIAQAQLFIPANPPTVTVQSTPRGVVTAFFNNDQFLDIAIANSFQNDGGSSGTVSLLMGNGNGTFQNAVNYTVGDGPYDLIKADFNNDGILDLATSDISGGGTNILLGNGSMGIGDGTFRPSITASTAQGQDLTAGFFNNDNILDIALAGRGAVIPILLGNGDGTFKAGTTIELATNIGGSGFETHDVTTADFNKDGKQDLATANDESTNMTVFLGNGDGTFKLPELFTIPNTSGSSESQGITHADYNGDGNLDIAITTIIGGSTGQATVFLGNGTGSFSVKSTNTIAPEPRGIVSADFNNDGKIDLGTASQQASEISILLGNGDGTFQAEQVYAVTTETHNLGAGDFNGDGKIDIVVPDYSTDVANIYLNNLLSGDITITPATCTSTGSIKVTGLGGATPYTFIFNGSPQPIPANNMWQYPNLSPGTYTFEITDPKGDLYNTTIIVPLAPDVTPPVVVTQNITVYLDATGNATITPAQINNGSTDNCSIASMTLSQTDFTCSNIVATGNTVTLTVTDASGNSASAQATVTVVDNTSPVAVAQNITVNLDATGNVVVTPAQINNGSTDNCSIQSTSLSQTNFTCANLGANTVTLTVTDESGNSSTAQAIVTVVDNTPPVAVAQNITIQLPVSGTITITPAQVNNGSTDNCSIASMSLSQTIFTGANLGNTTVTLTVTDESGNTSMANAIVTLVDVIPPVVITQNITVSLNSNGTVTVPASAVNNGSYSNSGVVTFTISPSTFTCANLGPNTVTFTATDGSGNTTTSTAIVTVVDNTPPVAVAQNITIQLPASGTTIVTPSQINNGSTDNCTIASMSLSQTTFTGANLGNTPVTLTVTDESGNTSTAPAIVTLIDNTPPVVVTQNITVSLNANGTVTVPASAVNNGSYDNSGVVNFTLSPSTFTCANLGPNTVTFTATDGSGNTTTSTAVVTVVDNTPPVAVAQNIAIQLPASGTATVTPSQINNGSTDNCSIASLALSQTTFTGANIGNTPVTLTVTDESGNTSTAPAIVTLIDNIPPVVITKNITVSLNANGTVTVPASAVNNGSYDNSGVVNFTLSPSTFTCANLGPNTVTFTATDGSGNTTTSTAVVTVTDPVPPIAIAQNITVALNAAGTATITSAQVNNGSSDNCSIASLALSQTSFTCANIGANTVTLTVTDESGNTATALATVTVVDNTAPVAKAQNITIDLNATGSAVVTAAQVNNGSTDNCTIQSLSLSQANFSCANIGANTVTLTVTDESGNTATAQAVLTVVDNIAPVAKAQNITIQLPASGTATITPSQVNNGSTDNCSIASLSLSQTSFTGANLGNTTVTLTVTDESGNPSTATAIVTLIDNIPPVVITKNITVSLNANGTVTVPASSVKNGSSDNSGVVSFTLSPSTFTCANLGPNTVTFTATDGSGNTTTSTAIVTVTDVTPPVAVAQNITVNLSAFGTATVTAAQVNNGSTDNCSIKSLSLSQASFTCSNLGANTVTLTVTDESGNTATAQATVTVVDNIKPTVITQNISVELTTSGSVTITAAQVNNGSTDNCSIKTLTLSPTTFTCANIGANTVTLTATDPSGNTSSATAVVTILNNPGILNVSLTSPTVIAGYNTSCNVTGDGSINLSVTGGQSPYTIKWNNGATGSSLSNLIAGTYSVTVTDKNTCATTQSIQLTRPAGCGCNPTFTVPSPSSYSCTQILDGTSSPSVNGGIACVNNSFSGNINFSSGTLVIKGNATISSLTLNANSQLIVLGTLTASSISLNSSSASITTYGTMTASSVSVSNGQWNNYGNVTVTSNVTLSGQGKLVNDGTLIVKSDLANGNVIQNYGLLSVGGVLTNNINTTFTNGCTVDVTGSNMVNDQGVQFQNGGTISIVGQLQFNGTVSALNPGSIIEAASVTTTGSSTFTDNGSGCALISLNGTANLTQTTFTGPIAFCDLNASGITTSNVQFNSGASISCSKCSYTGGLANGRYAALGTQQNSPQAAQINMFPNPANNGHTAITLSNSDFTYKVYTIQGILVTEGKSAGHEASLYLENAPAGLYIVQVKDLLDNIYTEKLIVGE